MIYSRVVYYKCHTWLQGIICALIGIILAIILWLFIKSIYLF